VRAGTSKSGLHNKPAVCGAAEAYGSGPGSEGEEELAVIRVWDEVVLNFCFIFFIECFTLLSVLFVEYLKMV
jgi:hypothetical protein